MHTVTIQEAQEQFEHLITQAAKGHSFIITDAEKPLVKVTPIHTASHRTNKRLGFLAGQFDIPENPDHLDDEIQLLFYSEHK